MRCHLYSLWTATTLLWMILHCGEARIHTEVQAGPLYRVLGSRLSMSCNVSGFANEKARQNFQFRFKKPQNPNMEINIISTNDDSFAYAMYSQRVAEGEITLTHLSVNSVIFVIQSLQKGDEGEYDCSVVNSESVFDGIYSAKTTVKVIDNSLSVSSSDSTSLSYNEGDALTLTCQASSNTIQHTHLSFAWFVHKVDEDSAKPIISLDRDFTLSPGQGFEERYQAGLIRLDKMGEATYRLTMSQLEVSDQGRIYCQAWEWIQDPDRSWYSIAQKEAAGTTLNVKAKEVVPDTMSLVVRISTQQTSLQEGQELSLTCNVDTHNPEKSFFSVAWLRGSVELARMGPTGVLSVGPEYSGREKQGELRVARIGDRDYHLALKPVRTEDQGDYVCRAWPQNRGQDGAFTQGAAQDSSLQQISISATESGLSVEMQRNVSVNEGDRLTLTCNVDGIKGQLSVTWQHKSTPTSTASFISLSQEGVMVIEGKFENRKIRATRPATGSFTLELDEVTPSDAGIYQCDVSEWKTNSKTDSQSQATTVTVISTDKFVRVSLISRKSVVTVGGNVELICRVKGPRVPVTLTWSVQRDGSVDTILTLYHDGSISWSGDQQGYQVRVENKAKEVIHYLLINGASHREAGSYQCSASVFLEKIHKRLGPSNTVAVEVQTPVSKLQLTSSSNLPTNISSDAKMHCSVISGSFASARYAVTWLRQEQAHNKTIISSNRDDLVTFGTQVKLSDQQRISMRRTQGPSFELTIRQAQVADRGSYKCEVVEWLQDPRGEWYQLSPVSTIAELTVTEPEINLSIVMDEVEQNVSTSQDFTIPCKIARQSSSESEFQVTWFWQKGTEVETQQSPIFTAYRNATLQVRHGKRDQLRFDHPLPEQFSLTVLKPSPEDSGLYYCEVEEWLPSLSHGWKNSAVKKSEYLTVNVYTDGGAVSEPQCNSGTWIGIFAGSVIVLLLVISALVYVMMRRGKGPGGKKSGESLWAEKHPLEPKSVAED